MFYASFCHHSQIMRIYKSGLGMSNDARFWLLHPCAQGTARVAQAEMADDSLLLEVPIEFVHKRFPGLADIVWVA